MEATSSAFERCSQCNGLGFLKQGDFANRSFRKCETCQGLGQKYLAAPPDRQVKPDAVFL